MTIERRKFLGTLGSLAGASVFSSQASGHENNDEKDEQTALPDALDGDTEYDPDFLQNDDLLDNDELEKLLRSIENVSVTTIGESNQGRPLWEASVGSGPTDVMVIAQQHGDELIMAEGTIAALQYLACADTTAVKKVRKELTVHLVPRVNPDGFVARQRYNVDTDAPAAAGADIFGADIGIFAADTPFVGWDVNRYHWPEWEDSDLYQSYPEKFPENPVPEAVAVDSRVEDLDTEWIIDFHRQGEYVVDEDLKFVDRQQYIDGELGEEEMYPPDPNDPGAGHIVTSSLFWPINEDVPEDARNLSKQLVYTMYDAITTESDTDVLTVGDEHTPNSTWYPGGTYAGIARNGFGLRGMGSVLFEVSAGTLGDRLYRIQHVAEAFLTAVKATADGSLTDVDPSKVEEIPGRGSSVTVEGEADRYVE
ncbi:Zinc carboxypeptidase [Halogranum rubrum]|uniref:Zinc carboxypeptidase n=1 Tax=Halogranum rubrum TaxID=553466 RepID=A0A1I4GX87_9EURY|nr:M14 family zinc carboxypeptidase [Halogranum rubrum]SFL34569.1 Zinc carboxypeptidase [Halogranum rubrum]